MILTYELGQKYHPFVLGKLCCPICLSPLFHSSVDRRRDHLSCKFCESTFLVQDRLPILLINDDNWRKKRDEIEGEVSFNVNKVPPEVHLERNAFVDKNTESFLRESKADLSKADTLIVGSSIAELEFFYRKSRSVVSLDIVPSLTKACLEATEERGIPAAWVCGDGECLPFEDESFDTVVVRQTLHHMLKYYSAICELFRVCKRGGRVLVIDEPFAAPNLKELRQLSFPDDMSIYGGVKLGEIRDKLKIRRRSVTDEPDRIRRIFTEKKTRYIEPEAQKPETFLADKYHTFSLIDCIMAFLHHSNDFQIFWPREIAWTVDFKKTVRFCRGDNPYYNRSILDKLVSPGNVSLSARKITHSSVFRDRSDIRALPLDLVYQLANS